LIIVVEGGEWIFLFEVKFYPMDPTLLHEELTRYDYVFICIMFRCRRCRLRVQCTFVLLLKFLYVNYTYRSLLKLSTVLILCRYQIYLQVREDICVGK